tara:strand:- start:85 stop:729 length:645 start_codon:yes stop_codon:yes gene_type:complete
MVIGLSGVAGAGKDLFFDLLSKKMPVRRFALADKLKWDCAKWCYREYDIDPLGCSREEKEQIREFLVFHGTFKRRLSKGQYWINKLGPDIKGFLLNAQTEDIPVITDIRYQEYKKDEVTWVKNELNGVLVHISQYENKEVPDKAQWPKTKIGKVFLEPTNEEEKRNDPILIKNADFLVKWKKINSDNPLDNDYLNEEVDKFVSWYNEKTKKENK